MNFSHRDLHSGNVMVKIIPSKTINVGFPINNQRFRPYIIDLGEVCVNLRCNNCINIQDPQIYDDPNKICTNRSHDLRMLMISLLIYNPDHKSRNFIRYLSYKFANYIARGLNHPHRFYERVINNIDVAFLPETILQEISLFFDTSGNYKNVPIDFTKIRN
jgi:hypothetical protein